MNKPSKNLRGRASQYFVAGELCRRNLIATITLGNCPNTDILCSNLESDRLAHIQVKTFVPPNHCIVGEKAEINRGKRFFWVLVGLPKNPDEPTKDFYVIPSPVMAKNVKEIYEMYMKALKRNGEKHSESSMRGVRTSSKNRNGWSIAKYKNKWELIEKVL